MSRRLARTLPVLVALVVLWQLLQGQPTAGNIAGGVALAAVLVIAFPVDMTARAHRIHPWALVKFLGFVLYSLVLSSWAVIKVIVRPTPASLRSGVVRVRLEHESELTATIVANAVTLTPGTMTLTARLDPVELHIHVLGLADPDEFRKSVHDLERRTVAAFTPVDPSAGVPATEVPA
jgi:multicomponent Na+:H+ antiporter subunit E